jgi:hypothetical protein
MFHMFNFYIICNGFQNHLIFVYNNFLYNIQFINFSKLSSYVIYFVYIIYVILSFNFDSYNKFIKQFIK